MKMKSLTLRRGILAGGNWVIDRVKIIDIYPQPKQLANILSQSQGIGGSPSNLLLDLAKSGAPFPLYGEGRVGKDVSGEQILAECRKHNIDTRYLTTAPQAPTSFTDVMTERVTGRRTFFHARGANAHWRGNGLEFGKIKARIFHVGHLLLLDALDGPDAKFGTQGARLLAAAQRAGIRTSIDVVSEDSDRFAGIVGPALKHVDYCILNEIEAGKTTGFKIRPAGGVLDTVALRHAAGALLQQGVREVAVIHFPEGAFARTRQGDDVWQPSLKLPPKYIVSTVGAGDAFCAGVLLGLHEDWPLQRCLLTGVCIAAASLSGVTGSTGVKPLNSSLALAKKFGFNPSLEPGG